MKENQQPNPGAGKEDAPGQNKEYNIIVNARPKTFKGKKITFEEVVALAYGDSTSGPQILYTVSFQRGEGNKPEGTMVEGDSINLKEGMIFNVTATNKS